MFVDTLGSHRTSVCVFLAVEQNQHESQGTVPSPGLFQLVECFLLRDIRQFHDVVHTREQIGRVSPIARSALFGRFD